jgi:predicted DCC family thiol-disulfide oxidoreductase YuxK
VQEPENIIFYDGHCLLCSKAIQYLLKYDKQHQLYFSPLQSDVAKKHLAHIPEPWPDTIILYSNNKTYLQSSAVLRASAKLNVWHKPLYLLLLVPPFIRNAVYDWVAKNRIRWFGKSDTCFLPYEWKDRILN